MLHTQKEKNSLDLFNDTILIDTAYEILRYVAASPIVWAWRIFRPSKCAPATYLQYDMVD